ILGGGQLGRMMGLAARSLGYRVQVLDPYENCPARAVADRVIVAPFDDVQAAVELAKTSSVITLEIENIASRSLEAAAQYCPTRPGVNVLAVSQDRRVEKKWLSSQGFPVAPYRVITTAAELAEAVRELGPSVVKTAREGYDGKGQARLESPDEAERAFAEVGEA